MGNKKEVLRVKTSIANKKGSKTNFLTFKTSLNSNPQKKIILQQCDVSDA